MRPKLHAVRALTPLVLALAVALASAAPAGAAVHAGDVEIDVVDAVSGAPVPLARVILAGDGATIGYTDADGRSHFESVASGTYRASVSKRGYDRQGSRLFEVESDHGTNLRVRLGRSDSKLKVIGSVAVTTQPLSASGDVAQESPLRALDGSLQDALGDLAGLTADRNGFSLEGRDPSQTGFSVDGVLLPSAGGSLANAGINADLFASASASTQPQNGALGGAVNFMTLQPTRFAQQFGTLQYAANGSSSMTLAARGSVNDLGYVVEHAVRGRTSPLDGLDFVDRSGLRYAHDGAGTSAGDLVKLRWSPALTQTLSATVLTSNARSALACAAQSGPFACGYGPGNTAGSHSLAAVLSETATIGSTSVFLGLGANMGSGFTDLSHRVVGGTAAPASSEYRTAARSATLSVQFPAHEKHELLLHASAYGVSLATLSANGASTASGSSATSYHEFGIEDTIRPNARLTLDASAAVVGSPESHAVQTSFGARWQPARADTFDVSAFAGASGAGISGAAALPDADSLQYFCDGAQATGTYGALPAARQRSAGVRARYAHTARRARFALSAWTERLKESPVTGVLDASALGVGADLVAAAGTIARSQFVCGADAASPSVAFLTPLLADQTSRGATVTGSLRLGARTMLAGYATVQSRFVTGGDPRAFGPGALTPLGAQVPDVPLHRAGLVVTSRVGRAVDVLANVSFVSANNPNHLPAYAVVNAGFAVPLRYGSLAVVAQNLTNRFASPIASSALAVPLARAGTAPLPTLAYPLAPRTVSLTYTIRAGRPGAEGTGASRRAATATPDGGTETTSSFSIGDLPAGPRTNALTIDPENEACTPVAARVTQPVLDGLGAIAAAAESARSGGRYPAALAGGTKTLGGVGLRYFTYDEGAAYGVALDTGNAYAGFAQCARLVGGDAAAVAKHHLYAPAAIAKSAAPPLFYSPSAGVYAVFPAEDDKDAIRIDDEPATAPANPLALRAECAAASRPLALELTAALRAAWDAGRSGAALPTSDVAVLAFHASATAPWVELRLTDPAAAPGIEQCLHVAGVRAGHLAGAGYAAPRKGSFGFSERYGLYFAAPDR